MSASRCARYRWLFAVCVSWLAAPASPLGAATVLFFVNDANAPRGADGPIVRALEDEGHDVVLFDTDNTGQLQQIDAVETSEADVALISETISSATMVFDNELSLKGIEIPIVSFEAYMWEDAGWTERLQFVDFGNTGRPPDLIDHPELHECQASLFLTENAGCLADGLSGEVEVYTQPYSLNFGFPSDDAEIIATVDEDEKFPTIFVYEAGDLLMDGTEAPAARIAFFLGQNASPNCDFPLSWEIVTPEGRELFFAAIQFALDSSAGAGCPVEGGPKFKRGDTNADGGINITDVVFLLNFLFGGQGELTCPDAADTNDSGDLNITDAVQLLNFLFVSGQDPAAPFQDCGEDPTEDANTECSYPPCGG